MGDAIYPVRKSDEEWATTLTPEQFRVLRQHGTERPGTSPLNDEKRQGTFALIRPEAQMFGDALQLFVVLQPGLFLEL